MVSIRIFISSPADVAAERDKARTVITQLARQYGEQVELSQILWEDLPLQADTSFQQGIDVVLSSEHGIDIAVFILWNRLGSPLGGGIRRSDGSEYRSGTEREFELMLEARRQSGGKRPALIAYARSDAQGFLDRLKGQDTNEIETALAQRKLAEGFVREHFHDAEGHNVRAYHSFTDPISFASRLRVHLRGLIDEVLGTAAPIAQWTEAPYRGLAMFDREHAPIFRGREQEICDLGLLLRRRAEQAGCAFVVVVGSSGSGKSSLVRAGLSASLVNDNVDSAVREWRCAIMLPSGADGDPVSSLARALTVPGALPELAGGADELAGSLRSAPQPTLMIAIKPAFAAAARQAAGPVRLLLIVDQLEELYTNSRIDPRARARFLEIIEALARSGDISVVATLRSDFFPLIQQEDIFLRLKGRDGQFDLGAPSLAAMRKIVIEPAQIAGLRFEQSDAGARLDDRLLSEAAELNDALPLVEFALRELYERRDGTLMTFHAFAVMGGVKGAIGTRAEAIYSSLPEPVQATFEPVFRQLVTLERSALARRWARRSEIARTPTEQSLIDCFITERLLTTTHDDQGPVIGITHEALLQSWPRLCDFIEASRDALRRRTRLELAHARWLEQPTDPSLLLQLGRPLSEGEELLAEMPDIVPEPLARYINQSRIHHEHLRAERRRQKLIVIGLSGVFALVALVGTGVAFLQQREARLAERRAAALHQVHQGDGQLERGDWPAALTLYEAAYRAAPDFATRSALLRGLRKVEPRLQQAFHALAAPGLALDFDADGALWSGDGDGAISTYELDQRRCVRCRITPTQAHKDALMDVKALRASSDGSGVAVLRDGRVVRLAAQGSTLLEFATRVACADRASCEIEGAAISPDGQWLVASDAETPRARLMTLTGDQAHQNIASPDGGRITVLAFDAAGSHVAFGTERGGVYTLATGTPSITTLRAANGVRITALAWGAHDRIAAADTSGEVFIASRAAEIPGLVLTHRAPVMGLAWDPTAARLATASANVVRVFAMEGTVASPAAPLELHGHRATVLALAWSDDGAELASSSDDRSLQVWRLEADAVPFSTSAEARSELHGLASSSDGKLIAAGTQDGRVCVWSVPTRRLLRCLGGGHRARVLSLAWHPHEPLLISADEAGVIRGWNWPHERYFTPASSAGQPHAHQGAVWSLAWFGDGRRLASSGYDRTVKLWDRAANTSRTVARLPDLALGMDVSPDGTHLAAASTDGVIRVWTAEGNADRADFTLPSTPDGSGHRNSVGALAFSHDGATLASAGNDGTVRLWDLRSRRVRAVSPAIGAHIESIAYAGDDSVIASTGGDGQLRVWDRITLEPLLSLPVHRRPAWRVVWNPDARQFVSTSSDATVSSVTWSEAAWMSRLQQLIDTPKVPE